jgi:hypothetical protein
LIIQPVDVYYKALLNKFKKHHKNAVLWIVASCGLVEGNEFFQGLMYKPSKCYLLLVRLLSLWFYPEDGSNTLL